VHILYKSYRATHACSQTIPRFRMELSLPAVGHVVECFHRPYLRAENKGSQGSLGGCNVNEKLFMCFSYDFCYLSEN
jgi:hypothetical protein